MGGCSFFWGNEMLARYGGGRVLPHDRGPSQLPEFRGRVAATQLETPWLGTRENAAQIEQFARVLASAIAHFVIHFIA